MIINQLVFLIETGKVKVEDHIYFYSLSPANYDGSTEHYHLMVFKPTFYRWIWQLKDAKEDKFLKVRNKDIKYLGRICKNHLTKPSIKVYKTIQDLYDTEVKNDFR